MRLSCTPRSNNFAGLTIAQTSMRSGEMRSPDAAADLTRLSVCVRAPFTRPARVSERTRQPSRMMK